MAKAKWRWKCTTKPRGNCPAHCQVRFIGYGLTRESAKQASERACQAAGCHTPGGHPFACDCGHTTSYQRPNEQRGILRMDPTYSFKFMDDNLNQRLLSLLKKAKIKHDVDHKGVIHYSRADEETVGNELLYSIRTKVFPGWQLLSCPPAWTERYKRYMIQHGVSFREELFNDQLGFLLPRKHRPHSWHLEEAGSTHPIRARCDVVLVKRLCHMLIENRRGKTLADEILRDLDMGAISDSTYRRLSRWCHPARPEPNAQPVAERISQELFGHVISRTN